MALTVGVVHRSNLERKGLRPFVEAARELPEVEFVLAGRWEDRRDRRPARAGPLPTSPSPAILSDDELDRCFRRARAYVQASWHEGFGLAVAEAMLAGCVPGRHRGRRAARGGRRHRRAHRGAGSRRGRRRRAAGARARSRAGRAAPGRERSSSSRSRRASTGSAPRSRRRSPRSRREAGEGLGRLHRRRRTRWCCGRSSSGSSAAATRSRSPRATTARRWACSSGSGFPYTSVGRHGGRWHRARRAAALARRSAALARWARRAALRPRPRPRLGRHRRGRRACCGSPRCRCRTTSSPACSGGSAGGRRGG